MEISLDTILSAYSIPWSTKIILELVIFIVGYWIIRIQMKTLHKVMTKGKGELIQGSLLGNIAYTALLAVVVLAALEPLGGNTSSALAILGAAGLAVGLTLKDSLASFATGVMLIVFRTIKTAFDKKGIRIPYSQHDVHLIQDAA